MLLQQSLRYVSAQSHNAAMQNAGGKETGIAETLPGGSDGSDSVNGDGSNSGGTGSDQENSGGAGDAESQGDGAESSAGSQAAQNGRSSQQGSDGSDDGATADTRIDLNTANLRAAGFHSRRGAGDRAAHSRSPAQHREVHQRRPAAGCLRHRHEDAHQDTAVGACARWGMRRRYMRDDGHMQGGGCHDRRRRNHTGGVATRPMGIGNARHRGPSPSAAKTAVGTSGCCRRLSPRGWLRRLLTNGGDG